MEIEKNSDEKDYLKRLLEDMTKEILSLDYRVLELTRKVEHQSRLIKLVSELHRNLSSVRNISELFLSSLEVIRRNTTYDVVSFFEIDSEGIVYRRDLENGERQWGELPGGYFQKLSETVKSGDSTVQEIKENCEIFSGFSHFIWQPIIKESNKIHALLVANRLEDWVSHRPLSECDFEIMEYVASSIGERFSSLMASEREKLALEKIVNEKSVKLETSEAINEAIFENSPIAICVISADSAVSYVNSAFCALTGFSSSEAVGKKAPFPWWPEEYHEKMKNSFRECLSEKSTGGIEIELKRKDGRPVNVSMYRYVVSKNERPWFCLSMFIDITERKRMEKERRELEAQFIQAQKMEAIGQLAGGIAHDFNNLLAAIIGHTEMIKREAGKGTRFEQRAEIILRAARRGAALTSNLLAFAQKKVNRNVEVDVHSLIEELAAILEHTLDRRIRLKLSLNAEEKIVRGDPTQLEQVLLNLAVNARDAMPDGGELCISTRSFKNGTEKKARLIIEVRDTGIGMTEEVKRRIFEPFFTTKSSTGGTGLGLASAYGIIKAHDGMITVDSEPGKGTTFRISLPAIEDFYSVSEIGKNEPSTGNGRVLLVDDDDLVRSTASEMLQELGYDVVLAQNAEEALLLYEKAVEENRGIDVVLLDMLLPDSGGLDIVRRLKAIDPLVRVVVTTGYGKDVSIKQALLENGVRAYVPKPFSWVDLSRAIKFAKDSDYANSAIDFSDAENI